MENREIKFRAWNGEKMISPDYLIGLEGNTSAELPSDLTLMQFTGLTDKNGKEIYEGDILKSEWGYSGLVDFEAIIYSKYECTLDNDMEVIGNIHQNPELL